MANKSAATTLDTFKEILNDISDVCDHIFEHGDVSHGYHILSEIRNFMSDRAKTNIAFTGLLTEYKHEIMPLLTEGWESLDENERKACSKVNNFFVVYIYL